MKSIVRESWSRIVNGTGGLRYEEFFQMACQYSLTDRHYHNLSHITQMFGQLLAIGWGSTDLYRAIWWHDYVYDSRANDNEERSAEAMVSTLRSWGVDQSECERAHLLVMFTKNHNVPDDDQEGKLLVDLDLSVLAASEEQYKVYATAIREEYRWVADEAYCKGRLDFLRAMLDRQSIFCSPHFSDWHEMQARKNLESETKRLVR